MTDEPDLVAACLTGSETAYGEFVCRFEGLVFGTCLRMLRDRHEAEDTAQEIFVRAIRGLKGWEFFSKLTDTTFLGWIMGMVVGAGTERHANQNSALKMDAKVIGMAHENAYLREKVADLSGGSRSYADKLRAQRDNDTQALPPL